MKIAFILPSLEGGGAERVILTLANLFSKNGYEIFLILISNKITYSDPLSKKIKIIKFGSARVINSVFKLRSFLKNEKPDILFSTLPHLNVFVLFFKIFFLKCSTKFVIRETNTLSEVEKSSNSLATQALHKMIKFQYPKADLIICPSKGVAKDLTKNFGIDKNLISIIYNPINFDLISDLAKEPIKNTSYFKRDAKIVIGLGSLSNQKDFPTLIKAVKEVNKIQKCILLIIGEGKERDNLKNLIKSLDLEQNVFLLGFKKNPFKFLKNADAFVLSSKYEGLPNSLIQALLLKVPCISTNCKSGPEEILNFGEYGQLVEVGNYYEISKSILNVFNRKWKNNYGNRFDYRFDENQILNRYMELQMFKINT